VSLCNIASNKGETSLKRAKKTVIMAGSEKTNGCWICIGFQDFIQKTILTGICSKPNSSTNGFS
jgi:hypothetical protein